MLFKRKKTDIFFKIFLKENQPSAYALQEVELACALRHQFPCAFSDNSSPWMLALLERKIRGTLRLFQNKQFFLCLQTPDMRFSLLPWQVVSVSMKLPRQAHSNCTCLGKSRLFISPCDTCRLGLKTGHFYSSATLPIYPIS